MTPMNFTLICLVALVMSTQAADTSVTGLRCEDRVDPMGLDEPAPRFTWTISSTQRGWMQSACRVLVASDAQCLVRDEGDLWDSGKVVGDASALVYSGKALAARQECHWKVQVWDAAGAVSAWSLPARFEMGLLGEADWGGAWIGRANKPRNDGAAPFLRKVFTVDGVVRRARLYASGLGYAELHLNGKKVGGDSVRDPGYSGFHHRVLAVAHDVTSHLSAGANAIGAILGTGWYDVHDEATWYFHKAPWRDRPRLRLLLAIDYSDGRSVLIPSDGTWKSTTGPILRDGIYTGEIYDARQELSGWNTATYDDSAWKPADMVSAPAGRIAFLKCPPVAITRTITPVAITQPKPGVFIVDMGENFAGHAQLTVQAPAGTTITMRYSERLDKTGMIERGKIDCYMTKTTPAQPFQTDTYICKGGGTETWEQRFSYHGFRYVEVTGFPGTPTVDHFRGRYAHTAFELSGSFTCSNDLINRIQAATVRAYHSNAQNIPTDCPQREKNGWTGDAQLACEAGLMNFRSATFYAKWLDDIADAQRADGGIAVIIPTSGWGDGKTWPGPINPPWDSAYHIIAWDVYRYTGDDRLLRRHFPGLKRYVDLVASHAKNGVTPGWVLGDWMPWSVTAPNELTSTTYLYHDARIVAAAAKALGKTDEATRYTALADGIRDGFNRRFLKNGRYANGTQCAQAMPLHYGLVPDVQRPAVFALLAADASKKGHIDAGILGAKYLLRVLAEGGRSDLVWRIASRTEQPGWGWWIKQGATTLWEDWKGTSSLNHIMFGDISNWFYQWLAGIGLDPEKPGFAHIRIQPQLVGDLTWVTAWHDSPRGRITSSWKKGADGFRLDLTIPANAQATVWMPAADATLVSEGGKPAAQAEGVKFLRQEGDRAVFAVGSGTYAFMTRMR